MDARIVNVADLVTGTFRLLDDELLACAVARELGATLVMVQQGIDRQVRSRYSCAPDPELYWELRVGVVDAEGITEAWAGLSTRYRDLPWDHYLPAFRVLAFLWKIMYERFKNEVAVAFTGKAFVGKQTYC